MKHKNEKNTGVKDPGTGKSPENNSGETNNIQPIIPEEDLCSREIFIDYDTNINDLYEDLLEESYKVNPREITMSIFNARELSFEDIENLSEMIHKRKLKVNLHAEESLDFTELTLCALCVTGKRWFSYNTFLNMESIHSITKNELERISKKISKRTGVEANVVSELYNRKAFIEAWVIFSDDSFTNNIVKNIGRNEKKTIIVNKDTDLVQLGKDLIADSYNGHPKATLLMIGNAKIFKISEIEKLSKIIRNIPLEVSTYVYDNIDLTELAMANLCRNKLFFILDVFNITMDTLEPLSEKELKRISKGITRFMGKDVEEIMKYYQNKDIIDLSK